ncbi:MAG: alpha/beta hydrolase domain-containing protein [Acidimicrobiia bacterium]
MATPPLPTTEELPTGSGVPDQSDPTSTSYDERELLLRGTGSVYGYGADTDEVVVVETGRPWTTRILARWPSDPAKFSGTVVVDVGHPEMGVGIMWMLAGRHLRREHHGYVLVTTRRNTLAYGDATPVTLLQDHDPVRYAPIEFDEGGLTWDILAQLAALVRHGGAHSPFPSAASKVFMGGFSGSGAYTLMYSRSFHDRWQRAEGGPLVDGYVIGEPSWYQHISSADDRIPADQAPRDLDVPAISLYGSSQRIFDHLVGCGTARIRDDADGPSCGVRTWEVAGSAHTARPGCDLPASDLDLGHYYHLAFDALARWSDGGAPPPRADRVELAAPSPDGRPRLRLDEHRNAIGGVRSVKLDVPVARYFTCPENSAGVMEVFPPDVLSALHGDHTAYADAVRVRASELTAEGWLLPDDAAQVVAEAEAFDGFSRSPMTT